MILAVKEAIKTYYRTKVQCDRCKRVDDDDLELQEYHHVNFIGGYRSVFGDGSHVQCDLCQRCLKELVGEFCREVEEGEDEPTG